MWSALFAAVIAAAAQAQPAPPASAGKTLAASECKACHGLDGRGVAPGIPHLAAQRLRYLMKSFDEFREGSRAHAALQSVVTALSADQVRAVAQYYAALPPILPARTPVFDAYSVGEQLAAGCAGCHGSDGNSTTSGIPSLAGQQPKYLFEATQEYMTGVRDAAPMVPALGKLRKLDVESLALFYASQTPIPFGAPSAADPQRGRVLSVVCSGCHGASGVSTDADTPSLAGLSASYLEGAIRRYRSAQRRTDAMKRAVETLADQDIGDIAAFYASQRSRPAARGEVLLRDTIAKCDRCHGGAVPDNPALAVPVIAGQDKDYLAMALRSYRDGKRGISVMHHMSVPYTDAVIESVASHYANKGRGR